MKKLNEISEKNPFKVPQNYFEEVNKKIILKTSGYDNEVKKVGLYGRLKPYLMIAASVTGLILLSYTAVKLFIPDRIDSNVSEVIIEENSDVYLNDIDIYSLEENVSSFFDTEDIPVINKADIIDYLILEDIEINTIYEQM